MNRYALAWIGCVRRDNARQAWRGKVARGADWCGNAGKAWRGLASQGSVWPGNVKTRRLRSPFLLGDIQMSECICKGNWISLNRKYRQHFGKKCIDSNGKEWVFVGLMIGEEDYHYVVWSKEETQFLSCVGRLGAGGWEFIFVDEGMEKI